MTDPEYASGQAAEPGPERHVEPSQDRGSDIVRVHAVGDNDGGERVRVLAWIGRQDLQGPAADRPARRLRVPGMPGEELRPPPGVEPVQGRAGAGEQVGG